MMAFASLDLSVTELEKEVDEMNNLLEKVTTKLEETLGIDLDGDGKGQIKKLNYQDNYRIWYVS